jgi:hypothetical protein
MFAEHLVDGLLRGDIVEPLRRLRHRTELGLALRGRHPRNGEHEPAARRQGARCTSCRSTWCPADKRRPTRARAAPAPAQRQAGRAACADLSLFQRRLRSMVRRHVDQLRKAHRKQGEAGWSKRSKAYHESSRRAHKGNDAVLRGVLCRSGRAKRVRSARPRARFAAELVASSSPPRAPRSMSPDSPAPSAAHAWESQQAGRLRQSRRGFPRRQSDDILFNGEWHETLNHLARRALDLVSRAPLAIKRDAIACSSAATRSGCRPDESETATVGDDPMTDDGHPRGRRFAA